MGGRVKPVTVGVFGGTFDPFHYGHAHAIEVALQTLDCVHVFPAHEHPYRKLPFLPFETRMKLANRTVRELFEARPEFRGRVVVQNLKLWKKWGIVPSDATIHLLRRYRDEKFYSRNTSLRTPYLVLGSDISNEEIRDRWVCGPEVITFPIIRIDRDEITTLRLPMECSSTRARAALRDRDYRAVKELVPLAKETIEAWEALKRL